MPARDRRESACRRRRRPPRGGGRPGRGTARGARRAPTRCPRNSRPTAPRPWLPTRTMSTRSASAASTIRSPGSPVHTRNETSTPASRPRSTSAWACCSRRSRTWSTRARKRPPGRSSEPGSITETTSSVAPEPRGEVERLVRRGRRGLATGPWRGAASGRRRRGRTPGTRATMPALVLRPRRHDRHPSDRPVRRGAPGRSRRRAPSRARR